MAEKALALWLADLLEADPNSKAHHDQVAAELRRLNGENEVIKHNSARLSQRLARTSDALMDARAQRDELLEACKEAEWNSQHLPESVRAKLEAAIAKAEGKK